MKKYLTKTERKILKMNIGKKKSPQIIEEIYEVPEREERENGAKNYLKK